MTSTKRTSTLSRERRRALASTVVDEDPIYGVKLRERRGRLTFEWTVPADPVLAAVQTSGVREWIESVEEGLVSRLRSSGLSWGDIGGLFGVSRQTAQQRWADAEVTLRSQLSQAVAAG